MAGIKQSTFRKILLSLPPVHEQKEISKHLNSLVAKVDVVAEKLASVKLAKKALMQDLLTGKVRVKVD